MRQRLDALLVARGLVRSRGRAAELIRAGKVSVAGARVTKPSASVAHDTPLTLADHGWVSRAAYKLVGALDDLGVDVPARVLDAGASTGGFTQVLLSRGAERVYAVDVGTDQLAAELRTDPRIVLYEQTNLRRLTLAHVEDQPVSLAVADVSFISLTAVLEPIFGVLHAQGAALLLVKPQFEVGRSRVGKGGVVRQGGLRREAVESVVQAAQQLGWWCIGSAESVLPGPAGNVEHFVHLRPAHLC